MRGSNSTLGDSLKPSVVIKAGKPCRAFLLDDIKSATDDFSDEHLIGRGGFGKVYKALIDDGSQILAIKRLDSISKQGEREFLTEIKTLTELRHDNLVALIGYCNDCGEMILVYEYMALGTLADHLFGSKKSDSPLSWIERLDICIGAGRGLDYLHTGRSMIHRDVKATNILLDENYTAKVSDFGLAKHLKSGKSETHVSTMVKGTLGYLDLHYFQTGQLTVNSDTYAFGVMLLEALTGRSVNNPGLGEDEEHGLMFWAKKKIRKGKGREIVDACLSSEICNDSLRIFLDVVARCLELEPKRRPTMSQVVLQLEVALKKQKGAMKQKAPGIWSWIVDRPTTTRKTETLIPGAETAFSITYRKTETLIPGAETTFSITDRKTETLIPVQSLVILVERIFQDVSLEHDFDKIKRATNNFSQENLLGHGGFGFVYKGTLENGDQIEVKRRTVESSEGDTEFRNEVIFLGKLRHKNLVKFHGFAIKGNERLLIYEFLLNRSLDKFISDPTKRASMDWNIRRNIIEKIAIGLTYLHEDCGFHIIHRDLKPSNILLDNNMNPKVADFGLARLSRIDQSYNITNAVAGTLGYMAPEYMKQGIFSTKSDVFNFGVLLLEIILGQEWLKFILEKGEDMLSFAWNSWPKKRVPEFIDPLLRVRTNSAVLEEIKIFVHVGLLCVQETPKERPSMPKVLQLLNSSSITMCPPPKPGLCHTPDSSCVEQMNRNSKNEASCSNANHSDSANYMSASHVEHVPVNRNSENETSCSNANYYGSAKYMPASSHVEHFPVKHKSDNEISRSNTNYYDCVECMPDSPPLNQVMMNDNEASPIAS